MPPSNSGVILIHPPVVKPSEPPPGLGKLSGALSAHGIRHTLIDANLEGMLHLLSRVPPSPSDNWTMRASRHIVGNLGSLRDIGVYGNLGRYQRAVADVNRLVQVSGGPSCRISLVDYEESNLSPQKSEDLLWAADHPEANPFYPYFSERLTSLIDAGAGDAVVGFSLNYLSQAICTFSMIGFLKRRYPSAKTVLGGGLVTSWMASPRWRNPFRGLVDEMVRGPGERALLAILGEPSTGERHFLPAFDGLSLNLYLSPGPILPYAASSGCYWRKCSFCPEKAEGTAFSAVPHDLVTRDLGRLSSQYGPTLVHFVDDAMSPSLMKRMVSDPPGRPWYGFSRITPDLSDVGFCRTLKDSGCVMLKLGLESGDEGVLDSLEKGITLDLSSKVLASLKQAGIATYVYLLFGTPTETADGARRTLEYVAAHHGRIDFLNLAIFNLPINCPEANSLDTRRFYEGDLSLYADFAHPKGWGRREVRSFLDREFKRHPAIRPILLRHPRLFGSNHASFFHIRNSL